MINRKRYIDLLISHKDNKIIKVITGLGRSGKSTLLELFKDYLLEEDIDPKAIQHINFELYDYYDIRNDHDLYKLIKSNAVDGKKNYVLFKA